MPRSRALLRGGHTSKKIVIRPYIKPPTLPENYYDDTVTSLLKSVSAASSGASSSATQPEMSLQTAYQAVVHLVSHQYGPRLYRDLIDHMKKATATILPDGNENTSGLSLLEYIPKQYQLYLEFLLLCRHVFLPMDRTHAWQPETKTVVVTSSNHSVSNLLPLWQVGLSHFQARLEELSLDKAIYKEWLDALLQDWNPSSDSLVERKNLQAIWYLWQDLGQLAVLPLQNDLQEYWKRQSDDWKQDYKAGTFLDFCYRKHVHVANWQPWLPSQWLWSIIESCLIQPHLNDEFLLGPQNLHPILHTQVFSAAGAAKTVAAANTGTATSTGPAAPGGPQVTSVQQLWLMSGRIPKGQAMVAKSIANFAKTQGLECVRKPVSVAPAGASNNKGGNNNSAMNNTQIVSDLLDLQDRLNNLIKTLPRGRETINLKNVWEEVANTEATPSIAELLAKFLDGILKSDKKMEHYKAQSEQWLLRIIAGLFVPLQAKDVFEAFYKRDLAKRLLWNRYVNIEVEKQVCSLLKAECGTGFTSKMEGMFQDVDWSRETMSVYKDAMKDLESSSGIQESSSSLEMDVQVLTTGYWPVYPQYPNLILPHSLQVLQDRFSNHYKVKYQGRRMAWQYSLGHCIIKCTALPKQYEFIVSLVQALVLIQFEQTNTRHKLPGLMQALGLEDRDEMERTLQSLASAKEGTRILRKIPFDASDNAATAAGGGKKKMRVKIDDRDEFEINRKFESKIRRIRIANILMRETKEERDKTVEVVTRDRLYLIDAVLVRILKARKTILHQALIPQVLEQMKVPAQASDIKQRIESLIEREYMERDAEDRNRYNYMA